MNNLYGSLQRVQHGKKETARCGSITIRYSVPPSIVQEAVKRTQATLAESVIRSVYAVYGERDLLP